MKFQSKSILYITSYVLITAIALTPVFAFAKENDNGKKKDNNRECLKAFGHFIAPGWIKKNGQLSVGEECYLPFGIGKKFGGNHSTTTSTTTVDTVAPIISAVSASPRTYNAIISWSTNERADSKVFYSTNSPVNTNSSSTLSVSLNRLIKDHRVELNSLSASTTYYFIVQSRDASGNTSTSLEASFKTKDSEDIVSPVITNAVAIVSSTSIQVSWNTNENSTAKAYYSTSTPVNVTTSTTPYVENTILTKVHTLDVSGLATSTKYYMVLESKDASGNVTRTNEFSFTTSSGM